jgi:MFS family permease
MANVDDLLRRWLDAGVIDDETAERIRQHEEGREKRGGEERPGILEALIYVGLAVVGVGAFVLIALVWNDLASWARIVVTAVPGLFALALGEMLRSAKDPGMRRGGSLAWVLGAGLLTGAVGVVVHEAGWDDADAVIWPALFAVGITLVLWVLLPWHPQLAALGFALGFLAMAIQIRTDHDGPAVFGGVLAALFVAWILLAEVGLLKPRVTARALGGLAVALGAYLVGIDPETAVAYESFAFMAGAALVVLSVLRGSFAYMVFGIGVLFVGFVTFTMQRVPDPIVGALVLMLAGVLLIAAVLILARWKPWQVVGGKA